MRWTNTVPAILIISLWSAAVHVPGLFSPLRDYHAYRQCQTASMARNYVRHGMHFLSPELDSGGLPARAGTEFPIYSYLLAVLFKYFGTKEIFGRLLSMVFAAWGAIFLYQFVKRRLGEGIAAWSGLVLCSLPVHIYFTRSVQPEPMALWGLLGFLTYADLWFHEQQKQRYWILAVLLGSIGPLLKLPYLYIVFPMWIYLATQGKGVKNLFRLSSLGMMAGILGLTFLWYGYAKTAPVVVLPLTRHDLIQNLAPALTPRLWRAQFVSRVPELVTTYSGLLFAAFGLYYFRRARAFGLFVFWSLVGIVYVVLLGEYGLIHRYTLLPLTPIAAVWIACGISTFWEHGRTRFFVKLLAVLFIVGIPVHAAFRINHWYRVEYAYLDRAHAALARVSTERDLVLVVTHEMPQTLYYLDRYGYQVEPDNWTLEGLNRFAERGVRYVFIPKDDNKTRLGEWKTVLKNRARLIEEDPDYLLYQFPARHG